MYCSASSRTTSLHKVLRGFAKYKSKRFWWRFKVMIANVFSSLVNWIRGMYPSSSNGRSSLRVTFDLMSNVCTLTFELSTPGIGYL